METGIRSYSRIFHTTYTYSIHKNVMEETSRKFDDEIARNNLRSRVCIVNQTQYTFTQPLFKKAPIRYESFVTFTCNLYFTENKSKMLCYCNYSVVARTAAENILNSFHFYRKPKQSTQKCKKRWASLQDPILKLANENGVR